MNALSVIEMLDMDTIQATLNKIATMQAIIKATLRDGHDFGTIPGTNKPTLYNAGAQKINMLFGVNAVLEIIDSTIDYSSGLIEYRFKCTLMKGNSPVAEGVGSCSSYEKKYRYINCKEQDLPVGIDKETCKQFTNDWGKVTYKIQNPDIADLNNTILKMSKKRSYVDATLQLAALSDLFTQDMEDMKDYIQSETTENLTVEEAAGYKIKFGKNKGKTLGELYKTDPGWIKWYSTSEKQDPIIVKAINILSAAAKEAHEKKAAATVIKVETTVDQETGEILDQKPTDDFFDGTPFEQGA